MSNYYYLVAGLPEVRSDDTKLTLHLQEIKQTLNETLTKRDRATVSPVFELYEAKNWLAYLRNSDAPLHPLGNSTADQFAEAVTLLKESENPKITQIPPYFSTFAYAFWENKPLFEGLSWDDQLTTLFYQNAMKCKNKFISQWFELNLNFNNLLAAYTCRKYGIDRQTAILGDNDVAALLRINSARDFGVSDYFEAAPQVLRLSEDADLLDRERKIDLLKWQWIEDKTVFDYFSIEVVAAYLMKLEIIERWLPLRQESGTAVFRELINTLKSGVKFSEEVINH